MVKQQPIEADASVVPMETETNVKDDDEEPVPESKKYPSSFQMLVKQIELNREQEIEDVFKINSNAMCEECKLGRKSASDDSSFRLIVIDCRLPMLQKEAMLPRTCKLNISN